MAESVFAPNRLTIGARPFQATQGMRESMGINPQKAALIATILDALLPATGPAGFASGLLDLPRAPLLDPSRLPAAPPPGGFPPASNPVELLQTGAARPTGEPLPPAISQGIPLALMGFAPMMLGRMATPGQKAFRQAAKPVRERLNLSAVKEPSGQPKRVFHGTSAEFKQFDPELRGKGAGGDLYGPGYYFTEDARIAGGEGETLGYSTPPSRLAEAHPGGILVDKDELTSRLKSGGQISGEIIESIEDAPNNKVLIKFRQHSPNVRPAFLDIRRPFRVDGMIPFEKVDELLEKSGVPNALFNKTVEFAKRGVDAEYGMGGERVYEVLRQYLNKEQIQEVLADAGYDGITHIGGSGDKTHRVWIAFDPEQVIPAYESGAPTHMRQKAALREKEFPAKFGESQTPIANPKSKVKEDVFHGTTFDFNSLDISEASPHSARGKAIYFTSSPEEAEWFASGTRSNDPWGLNRQTGESSRVVKAKINIERPFYADNKIDALWDGENLTKFGEEVEGKIRQHPSAGPDFSLTDHLEDGGHFRAFGDPEKPKGYELYDYMVSLFSDNEDNTDLANEVIKSLGFDGIIETSFNKSGKAQGAKDYVVFSPKQIQIIP